MRQGGLGMHDWMKGFPSTCSHPMWLRSTPQRTALPPEQPLPWVMQGWVQVITWANTCTFHGKWGPPGPGGSHSC